MRKRIKQKMGIGTSLAVQWLRLHASNAGGAGSIPSQGTKITHTAWSGPKKKKNRKENGDSECHRHGSVR